MNQKEINEIGKKYLELLRKAPDFEAFTKGFKKKGWRKVRNLDAWINNKDGIVVKFSSTFGDKPRNKVIIPSFSRRNYPKKSEVGSSSFIVQPLALTDKKSRNKAYKELDSLNIYVGEDFHHGNVGYYEGRAVVFDW